MGDALLRAVANRLNECVREEDLISRLGGDEFILVFEETSKEEITLIADRILQSIASPYPIVENNDILVTPSIGISIYPEDGMNFESLIKSADKAMYFAKEKGKNNYQFYTPELENYNVRASLFDKFLKWFQK